MSTPFFVADWASVKPNIGAIKDGIGLIATIIGTLVGEMFLSWLGINRLPWILGGFQAINNLAYLALAFWGKSYSFMILTIMILTINIENFCTGLGTATFLGFLMSLCNKQFSATQYTLRSRVYPFS